ncbi:hypothetical protein HPC49_46520 [Pyxidicoccus fallax]|uniref:Uncharacterized protein n=1 Tax=Pyxidicoccus fallax TaxID=394095 RepID=A0A848LY41_9BACT|nr:hypothetical protein [Pyxidicoccus fallax]NMO22541.1 hypothetical protein [Pyxidicoccus fallax]NPC85632.1 hypothetical protein [Pyxidicoccus fallax]
MQWHHCTANHWSRLEVAPATCPEPACAQAIDRSFDDVELKPWHSYGAVDPTPHDVSAFSAGMTFDTAANADYLQNKTKPDHAGDLDAYKKVLGKVGAINSIMRIASDAMEEYFDLLYAMSTADIDACLDLARKGSVYFEGIPRDLQCLLLRRMAGTVKTDLGFVEEDVDIEFRSRDKLGGFFVVRASNYDEIKEAVEKLGTSLEMDNEELAEVMTAETAQDVRDTLDDHAWSKRDYPDVFKNRVELFFRTHSMLIRALEPARRRAAGPINAIAQALWRKGLIDSEDILAKEGDYALMSHSGASAKTATVEGDEGKELRKTKARNILVKLLEETKTGTKSRKHDRSDDYDLKVLARGIMAWLDAFRDSADRKNYKKVDVIEVDKKVPKNKKDPTPIDVTVKKVKTYFVKVNSKQYYQGTFVQAGKKSRYDAPAKKDRSMQGVVRLYLRTEGPELDAEVEEQTENLKNLFLGLLIADHGRWA